MSEASEASEAARRCGRCGKQYVPGDGGLCSSCRGYVDAANGTQPGDQVLSNTGAGKVGG